MNKTELSKRVAERLAIPHRGVLEVLKMMDEVFIEAIKEDGYIIWQGFGAFNLWQQSAREGRNPKTGEPASIRARNSLKFKPGKRMLEELNAKAINNKGK